MDDENIIPADAPESTSKTLCGCKGLVLQAVAGTGAIALPACPNDGVDYVLHCFNGSVSWQRV